MKNIALIAISLIVGAQCYASGPGKKSSAAASTVSADKKAAKEYSPIAQAALNETAKLVKRIVQDIHGPYGVSQHQRVLENGYRMKLIAQMLQQQEIVMHKRFDSIERQFQQLSLALAAKTNKSE